MKDNLRDKISELYAGLGVYVRFYVRARSRLLNLDHYAQFLPPAGLLIDVGCGRGIMANYLSLRFPDSQVIGIDLDPERIDVARKTIGERGNITFLLRDARDWALPDCTGVIMTDFLHHVSRRDQDLILTNVFQSLEPGGVLLIAEVDPTAQPVYRYWVSSLSDRVLYPSARSCFRKPCDWESNLSHLGFTVKSTRLRDPVFAGILYVCQR